MNPEINPQDQNKAKKSAIDKSRRSFAKTGISAPILLSFVSRSTWAVDNCSFNQALSGNMSAGANPECGPNVISSRSPGFYQGQPVDRWLSDYGVNDEIFGNVFLNLPSVRLGYKAGNSVHITNYNPTFKEILDAKNTKIEGNKTLLIFEPNEVNAQNARSLHYIAAYLNALSPVFVFPFTVADIVADWGVWNYWQALQAIQIDGGMTVAEVSIILNP